MHLFSSLKRQESERWQVSKSHSSSSAVSSRLPPMANAEDGAMPWADAICFGNTYKEMYIHLFSYQNQKDQAMDFASVHVNVQ